MLIIMLWVEKLRPIIKLINLKLIVGLELLITRMFSVKVSLKIAPKKYLLSILLWKLILRHKIKDLEAEKITGSFYEKEFMLSIL